MTGVRNRGHRGHRLAGVRAVVLAAVLWLLAATVTACGGPADDDVRVRGDGFTVDGQPWKFVGFDLYDAAATDRYACSPSTRLSQDQLTDLLRRAHDEAGATVVRFWAYQTYTDGGRDWSGVDQVLRAARKAHLRALPVLEDGPGNCTTGDPGVSKQSYPGDAYYTDGYRTPYGSARLSLRDYARVIARHYRDDPTVLGWMMVNEAVTERRTPDGGTVLAPFAADLAGVLHAADPNHLVTLGTQGNSAPGASGPDFEAVYAQRGLDFAEVHDYDHPDEAMPGSDAGRLPDVGAGTCQDRRAPLACAFAWMPGLHKPLVVGEAGVTASDPAGRARRADQLDAKMRAAFGAGADGYLVWHLSTAPSDGYDVEPTLHDPLLGRMKALARTLPTPH